MINPPSSKLHNCKSTITSIDADTLIKFLSNLSKNRRWIIGIAGPPGSGKSTLASLLQSTLKCKGKQCEVLPMDGFHLDDTLLKARHRLPWKGAPDTFDVDGLCQMLARIRCQTTNEIIVPVFDRSLEIARAGARCIPPTAELIIVEGNYLLSNIPPWKNLAQYFDKTIMLDTPVDTLRSRLRNRWISYGLDEESINRKIDGNDLPNGNFVYETSSTPDFIYKPF